MFARILRGRLKGSGRFQSGCPKIKSKYKTKTFLSCTKLKQPRKYFKWRTKKKIAVRRKREN